MIKIKNTNNKVCVLSDTDRKAVKVMSKENNANAIKEMELYRVKVEKEKYKKVLNLCKKLEDAIEELDEYDLLIESTFIDFPNNNNPAQTVKYYPEKIKWTIQSIANFHHSLNKSLFDLERKAV